MRTADNRGAIDRSGEAPRLPETSDELGLTPRENQILAWVAHGKTNAEVAQILWVAPSTVRKHLENIYAKLGVHTRTAVMRLLGVLDDRGAAGNHLGMTKAAWGACAASCHLKPAVDTISAICTVPSNPSPPSKREDKRGSKECTSR